MQETVGEKILNFFYDSSGQAIGFKYRSSQNSNGSYYYYMYNSRGDILGFYDYTGAVYVTYTYDAWGKVTSVKNSSGQNVISPDLLANIQPLRYRGYVYDNETGLYYLRSRYYDPVTRRFINADGLVSTGSGVLGYNMFVYCNNNPSSLVDDGGNRPTAGTSLKDESSGDRSISMQYQTLANTGSDSFWSMTRAYSRSIRLLLNKTSFDSSSNKEHIAIQFNIKDISYHFYLTSTTMTQYVVVLSDIIKYKNGVSLSYFQRSQMFGEIFLHIGMYNFCEMTQWDIYRSSWRKADIDIYNGVVKDKREGFKEGIESFLINCVSAFMGGFCYEE